jgi:hypothetical protein
LPIKPLNFYQGPGKLVGRMTSPFPSAGNSPSSGYVSAGINLAGSSQSPSSPECELCEKIRKSLQPDSKWPPKKNLEIPCHGYPALAGFMFNNPGFESFQAFRDLHIKSLLYYQGQLDKIREDLHALEWADHDIATFKYHEELSKNVDFLFKPETNPAAGVIQIIGGTENALSAGSETVGGAIDGKGKQMRKVEEMRKVLKEYSKEFSIFYYILP